MVSGWGFREDYGKGEGGLKSSNTREARRGETKGELLINKS